jgi:hypothetical protein
LRNGFKSFIDPAAYTRLKQNSSPEETVLLTDNAASHVDFKSNIVKSNMPFHAFGPQIIDPINGTGLCRMVVNVSSELFSSDKGGEQVRRQLACC